MILRHVAIDCADPYKLASFWSAVTGWPLSAEDEVDDDEALLTAPEPLPGFLFIRVPEGKTVKNRIHFDWVPTERTRDEEVERLFTVGATLYEDHRTADGRGWATLLDPEGNEFCVERSTSERSKAEQAGT
ncbi:VOC family protein [Nocardia sp. NPDC051052]|uniref:VOC family protein n=1 Tax=Nocardia sp. NPDC051052 TaxID=3364322 RepID=UPI0037ADE0FE